MTELAPLARADLVTAYRQMQLIRRFEETALSLRLADRIYGTMHPYIGEEAIAVGVCLALKPEDRIVSTHRGHGHCIAKGGDVRRMMAELFGKRTGYCKGKAGSMHIADFSIGMLGANGIVGAGLPIALGSALASIVKKDMAVTVGFFGDGATGEGTFHESLNLAALWRLPIVWVCENNRYAAETAFEDSLAAPSVSHLAAGYGMPTTGIDGNDVEAVFSAARLAIGRARGGDGPSLIECRTFRVGVHAQRGVPIPERRSAAEIEHWNALDPIARARGWLREKAWADDEQLQALDQSVEEQLREAVVFAETSELPTPEAALDDMWAPDRVAR